MKKRRRKFKPFLPLIIMGSRRSLVDTMEQLRALRRTE